MKRILIVEDDTDIQKLYKRLVLDTFDDVQVVQSFNGKEGLNEVQQHEPDMILLDLLMPVMDGETFLKKLRHELKITRVPVIVCSVNQTLANRLYRNGEANAALPKIFPLDDLVVLVAKFLG